MVKGGFCGSVFQDSVIGGNYGSDLSCGRRPTVESRCKGVPDKDVQYPHGCFFVNMAGFACQFKGCREFCDGDLVAWIKEVHFSLRLTFLGHL